MKKLFGIVCLVAAVLLGGSWSVQASPATGTIHIQLTESQQGNSPEGVVFHAWQVADLQNGTFESLEPWKKADVQFEHLDTDEERQAAIEKLLPLAEGQEPLSATTDKAGLTSFNRVPMGVWLIVPADLANYDKAAPALVSLPFRNPETGKLDTDITVRPKAESWPELHVTKVDSETEEPIENNPATFAIYADPDCTELLGIQKGSRKAVSEFLVTEDTVWLKEVGAPAGYEIEKQPLKVQMDAELETVTFANDRIPGEAPEEEVEKEEEETPGAIQHVNTGLKTGGLFALASLALAGFVLFGMRKK